MPADLTTLLARWNRGDGQALDQLLPHVYAELRRIAARQLRHERDDHTLQATALVHEAYLRLAGQRRVDWHDRTHFYGVAAQIMRRILVDHARRHGAAKRGDGVIPVPLDEARTKAVTESVRVLELDRALERLAAMDAGLATIVELRAFAGLTIEEAAGVLQVSPSTAKREWRSARAWLIRELALGDRP